MNTEEKPSVPGTHYGQLSENEEWFWDGTGRPDNGWIPTPEQKAEVTPYTKPATKKVHVICCGAADAAFQTDLSGYSGLTPALFYIWPANDLMVRFGL